jgi:hypothetical protein
MKVFKNSLAAEYDYIDVVYIKAASSPHAKFYFECTQAELDWAISSGAVSEAHKNTFVR